LALVPDEVEVRRPESLDTLDEFFYWREAAEKLPGVRDERQEAVREDVRSWFGEAFPDIKLGEPGTAADYQPAEKWDESMLGKLIDYLHHNHTDADGMSWAELIASRDFLNATLELNADSKAGVDLSGGKTSHAFVVPVRLSSQNPEYSDEIRPLVPAFHYVPDELVPYFMRDLQTFIADRYVDGGYVAVAPITNDMRHDILEHAQDKVSFFRLARERVNAAVDLAHSLGAVDYGYGATLPGVMNWGKATKNTEVTTTTGHGGTTALMDMIIDEAIEKVMPEKRDTLRIGVLGLGRIGLSATQVVAQLHPGVEFNVFDPVAKNVDQLVASHDDPDRFTRRDNEKDVIENSDIILSTATTTFNLTDPSKPNYIDIKSLEGKVIIDDSEPHSFIPEEVIAMGGMVLDVIGRDWSGKILQRETDFGYGHTLADGRRDAFGCELEARMLRKLREDLAPLPKEIIDKTIGEYALRGPVTASHTLMWINLFKHYGIGPAPLQAFGKEYELPA
jgi:hypothetical protein